MKPNRVFVRAPSHLGVATQPLYALAAEINARPHQARKRPEADFPLWHVKSGNVKGFYKEKHHTLSPVRVITGEDAQKYKF